MKKKIMMSASSSSSLPAVFSLLLSVFLLLSLPSPSLADQQPAVAQTASTDHEREYSRLYDATEDKDALEAIRDLHRQLDDDNDGAIEPSETGDFIRADLKYGSDKQRQKNFHGKDEEITVKDLWVTWKRSEVFNWTVEQVADWLKVSVELPQYAGRFRELGVNGTQLPKAAVSSSYLSKVLGITNPIHRSKINLKAMDVVLFGAPRDSSNFLKDAVLTSLLVVAVSGLFYAYRQNKKSQEHLQRMMHDMDGLAKAEQTLLELQEKLQQKDSKIESLATLSHSNSHASGGDVPDTIEISRLKEELEILRGELQRAEIELEDKCWVSPPVLQHWLQLTYEIETATYNGKKKAAEEQMDLAKDMCERLKRKRSSLVGAFVSTHGGSIGDVDRSILEARTALLDLTRDLTERTQRWRQIEMLCGCSIVANPGMHVLQNLVRHVGRGHLVARGAAATASVVTGGGGGGGSGKLSGSVSQDDLLADLDLDSHSVASSSTHQSSSNAGMSSRLSATHLPALSSAKTKRRADLKSLSRESSKESSSSDELLPPLPSAGDNVSHPLGATSSSVSSARTSISSSIYGGVTRSATPPVVRKPVEPAEANKRSRMVKSHSQDASGSIQETAAAASSSTAGAASPGSASRSSASHSSKSSNPGIASSMKPSVSESHLVAQDRKGSAGGMSSSSSSLQLSRPSVVEEKEDSDSGSGSTTDLDKKKKGKKLFFNFRRKKEKKDVM